MSATATATISDCVDHARRQLPRLEADILASRALGVERSDLYAFPERFVAPTAGVRVTDWVDRRAHGEPVAYILGQREFWGLDLEVTPAALIPRPDTETLVEAALRHVGAQGRVADIGTGCGAVALAIASERPAARLIATDIEPACVELAQRNAVRLGLDIDVRQSDLFGGIGGSFDVIVSNPPYVKATDIHLHRGDLRFEPRTALVGGGPDGLGVIERLVGEAPAYLVDGGWLCVEHGAMQAGRVRDLFAGAGFERIHCRRDLAGRPRVTVGQRR